jgi:XTP/dITP diphosphohydrolase/tetrapyrrole methylase family protein/MazG family protein/ATP diphosphatase
VTEKLIRRHPHVFGEIEVADAAEVLRNWDQIKSTETGREPGIFGEVPENLPALLHARKLQRRVASTGFDFPGVDGPLSALADELAELELAVSRDDREHRFHELGDVLFAAVNLSRKLHLDPELALRAASERFRGRVLVAAELAASDGRSWDDLPAEQQLQYYASARLKEGDSGPQ